MPLWVLMLLVVMLIMGLLLILHLLVVQLRQMRDAMQAEVTASGETVIIAPTAVSYRGAERTYGRVKSIGIGSLTARMVRVQPLGVKGFAIPCAEITEVSEHPWFLGSYQGGQHLVLTLGDGNRVGLRTRDNALWIAGLRHAGVPVGGAGASSSQ